jgi:hypothetical protein
MVNVIINKCHALVVTYVIQFPVLMAFVFQPLLIVMMVLTVRKIVVIPLKDVFMPLITITVILLILARILLVLRPRVV